MASPALDIGAIRATLKEQPDGVLDDIARRHGVSLRVVLELLPDVAARSAPGARFASPRGRGGFALALTTCLVSVPEAASAAQGHH